MALNILHLHSSFGRGGKEARAVRLMNAFGNKARHMIVSGVAEETGATQLIAKGIKWEVEMDPPPLVGKPSVKRYEAIARYMRRFDLVLTYNWGAIDGVMAKRVFGSKPGALPPVIHHEDGFNADEAVRLSHVRNLYRRMALGAADALVVPSHRLEAIATRYWKQPPSKLHRISNGIPTGLYAKRADPKAIPGFKRKPGEIVIGTVAGLRAVKDLPMLVRAAAGMNSKVRVVIVGEGPERDNIVEAAELMGFEDELLMPGFLPEPHRYIGNFDIFALTSKSEQQPIAVMEAMAAGLPVVAPAVGDISEMVADDNRSFVSNDWTAVRLRDRLDALAKNPELRTRIGEANRARAAALFDEKAMIASYAALYANIAGKPGALG